MQGTSVAMEEEPHTMPGTDDIAQPSALHPTVLVVEHMRADAIVIAAHLGAAGYYPPLAATAAEGVRLAESLAPGLIVLNQGLPDMSGFRLTQKLSLSPKTSMIPVVLAGRAGDPGTKAWALRAGAVDYLSKEEELSARLVEVVRRHCRPPGPETNADIAGILDLEQLRAVREIVREVQADPYLNDQGKTAVIVAEVSHLLGLKRVQGKLMDLENRAAEEEHEWLTAAAGIIVDPSIRRFAARLAGWPGYDDIALVAPSSPLFGRYIPNE